MHYEEQIKYCEDVITVLKEELAKNSVLSDASVKRLNALIVDVRALRATEIKRRLIAGDKARDIAVALACSPGYVSQLKKELVAAGLL